MDADIVLKRIKASLQKQQGVTIVGEGKEDNDDNSYKKVIGSIKLKDFFSVEQIQHLEHVLNEVLLLDNDIIPTKTGFGEYTLNFCWFVQAGTSLNDSISVFSFIVLAEGEFFEYWGNCYTSPESITTGGFWESHMLLVSKDESVLSGLYKVTGARLYKAELEERLVFLLEKGKDCIGKDIDFGRLFGGKIWSTVHETMRKYIKKDNEQKFLSVTGLPAPIPYRNDFYEETPHEWQYYTYQFGILLKNYLTKGQIEELDKTFVEETLKKRELSSIGDVKLVIEIIVDDYEYLKVDYGITFPFWFSDEDFRLKGDSYDNSYTYMFDGLVNKNSITSLNDFKGEFFIDEDGLDHPMIIFRYENYNSMYDSGKDRRLQDDVKKYLKSILPRKAVIKAVTDYFSKLEN